uniref:Uncharacterized protein n=1 Tax=Arundo donax TaxID=35708 RepID=A0A0A9G4N2_ARUDO
MGPAMKQVESQYNNRRYRLVQAYRKNVARPTHVSPDDCRWLIRNLWTDPDFQKRSDQNSQQGETRDGIESSNKIDCSNCLLFERPRNQCMANCYASLEGNISKTDGTLSIPSGKETLIRTYTLQGTVDPFNSAFFLLMICLASFYMLDGSMHGLCQYPRIFFKSFFVFCIHAAWQKSNQMNSAQLI